MKILDPGHTYELNHLDGENKSILTFVKREGDNYPGNVGEYEGTNLQEVLRALIDRVKYLNNQIPCSQNEQIITNLRHSIFLLEQRAAVRHGRKPLEGWWNIEFKPICNKCGHIGCKGNCHSKGE